MTQKNEKQIKIVVADRSLRIMVKPEEEARVRSAAKIIKQRIRDMQQHYGAPDRYEYLAMVSLSLCVELLEIQAQKNNNNPVEIHEQLNDLDNILSSFLDNKQ